MFSSPLAMCSVPSKTMKCSSSFLWICIGAPFWGSATISSIANAPLGLLDGGVDFEAFSRRYLQPFTIALCPR